MYQVQIIDDEPITRLGLTKMVDWEEIGFEISSLAANGKEGLEQLEIEDVDLIITDIEMPIMGGIEYIEKVRELEKENLSAHRKEIIVISAYDHFEYAKEALRYGVSQYILKPIDADEFRNILLELKIKLDVTHSR